MNATSSNVFGSIPVGQSKAVKVTRGGNRRTKVGRRPVRVRQMWEVQPACPAALFRSPTEPVR